MPRKHPRVSLAAQVESRASRAVAVGRTENISVGGALILSADTFAPGAEVLVRFRLPSGHPIEAPGRVAHARPGVRMGIEFIHLTEEDRKAIADYVQQVQPYTRRSSRIAKQLAVVLRWRDRDGNPREELAETVMLSRHGGLLLSPTSFKPGEDLFLWWPQAEKGAGIRIVFRQLGSAENLAQLGFEFVGVENFWGIDFPSEVAWWEPST